MSIEAETHETDFDPDALREKYRLERDKRLRADGNEQYMNTSEGQPDQATPKASSNTS